MRAYLRAIGIGCVIAGGLILVALMYPGENPLVATPQQHTEELIMDALAPAATTTSDQTSEALLTPEAVVNSLDERPTSSKGYKEQEIISAVFDAIARADKHQYPTLLSLDYERLYDSRVFTSQAEIRALLTQCESARREVSADIETYYELRITYARDALKEHNVPETSQANFIQGLRMSAAITKPYNVRYLQAVGDHLDQLTALYRFLLEHYGSYDIVDDGDGPYPFFDTEELLEEYTAYAAHVDESGTAVDEAYTALLEVTNAALKEQGLELDAEEVFEKMKEKYY